MIVRFRKVLVVVQSAHSPSYRHDANYKGKVREPRRVGVEAPRPECHSYHHHPGGKHEADEAPRYSWVRVHDPEGSHTATEDEDSPRHEDVQEHGHDIHPDAMAMHEDRALGPKPVLEERHRVRVLLHAFCLSAAASAPGAGRPGTGLLP